MKILIFLLLAAGAAVLWYLAGKYEWQIPGTAVKRIESCLAKIVKEEHPESLHINVFSDKTMVTDLEKEIYIFRKNNPARGNRIILNIHFAPGQNWGREMKRLKKLKSCLERRFPELAVHFALEDQEEEKGAFLHCD